MAIGEWNLFLFDVNRTVLLSFDTQWFAILAYKQDSNMADYSYTYAWAVLDMQWRATYSVMLSFDTH